jgi:hypothetical protein
MSGNVMTLRRKREKRPVVKIWGEVKLPRTKDSDERQLLRAHPRSDNFGGFFDWVEARFDVVGEGHQDSEEDSDDSDSRKAQDHVAPAKLLAFHADTEGEEWTGGKETAWGNTGLTTNCNLAFQSSGHPAVRQIRLEGAHRALHVIERRRHSAPLPPGTTVKRDHQKEHAVSVVKPRGDWAEIFHWWAKNEVDPWPDETLGLGIKDDLMSTDDEDGS